jgi:hypothetical protein
MEVMQGTLFTDLLPIETSMAEHTLKSMDQQEL